MLSLQVVKSLPGFTLDVAWDAGDEVVALFGPSGAGKTLTLHCLAGLVPPDSGRIVVNGSVFFDSASRMNLPTRRRRLGYVFQGFALFPHLTVLENVGFGLHDRPKEERRRRVGETIERLGLSGLEGRHPRELSGGQQQRVALGRALAVDPDLLLLDEPLSALDAPLRRQLREELGAIIREWGKAVVLVTHDLGEAYQLADRIVVYEAGRVVQAAPKSELLWQPASENVARLMGARNILHGVVVKATQDLIQLRWRDHVIEAANSPSFRYEAPPGGPATFCVRPEFVRLIRKDRGEPNPDVHQNLLEGEITGEVDQGAIWTLYFRLLAPGTPSQGEYDLEIDVSRMVYELLEIKRERRWVVFINRSSIQLLPER